MLEGMKFEFLGHADIRDKRKSCKEYSIPRLLVSCCNNIYNFNYFVMINQFKSAFIDMNKFFGPKKNQYHDLNNAGQYTYRYVYNSFW